MVRNITLSAEESMIRKARERAQKEGTSLNMVFRDWLKRYAAEEATVQKYEDLMNHLQYVRAGRIFSRGEFNER